MNRPSLFRDARLVMVGPQHHLREVAFDQLGERPAIGGIEMKWLGPVDLDAMQSLTTEAKQYTRRHGYPPDTFGLVGLGREKLVALVPRSRPQDHQEVKRLRQLLGITS